MEEQRLPKSKLYNFLKYAKGAGKVRFTPLVFLSALCVLLYYAGWVIYYCGIGSPWVILL